ncbi:HlyD family efflux transporter periplasmic adaptor subunit [Clostridium sp. PL3]|uniref:HlyD family efflux transporter periplasmic adaptor subunit n=1 Tax=Clostridium thailandense TaxID=2794346 RepID=A0A949WR06_9CLOT|nr:HlyD family efflux transporter periplasmic adaptor subunit [Clostridium thailandense]MBV7273425.1 HlyD family efflux transporter periplasmic adaptor subunit [Clostridium thailandense]
MKSKKAVLVIGAIITCTFAALAYVKLQGGQKVETTVVAKGEIKQYVEDTATVKSSGKQTVYIEGSGKINSIKVSVGSSVKKGDVLLTMDKGDLELKLQDANAKIEAAKAELQGTDISNSVNKIEIAQAAVDVAKVTYEAAARDLNNKKKLYASGSISKQELNNSEDEYKNAEAALKSANYQLEDIKGGTPDYVKSQYLAQIEQSVILRDSVTRDLEKQQVVAPVDGVILEKMVDKNAPGTAGTAAFLIGDTKSLELEANILSDDVYKVKIGNEVEVSGKAIGSSLIKGKVIKIAPEAKEITSSLGVNQKRVPVTIEISGDLTLLKPDYDLDIKIVTEAKNNTLIVPDSALFDYKGSTCVFVVDSGKAIIRQVKKGIESEKIIEIVGGLKSGEKILSNPDNNIKEGMKIKL